MPPAMFEFICWTCTYSVSTVCSLFTFDWLNTKWISGTFLKLRRLLAVNKVISRSWVILALISPFTFTSSRSTLCIKNEQILRSYSGSFLSALCNPSESTMSRYSTGLFGFRILWTDKYKPEVQRP